MRVLLISDSHGRGDLLCRILAEAGPVDAVLHAGDGKGDLERVPACVPLYAVRGNCDGFSGAPLAQTVRIGGQCMYLTHGHAHGVKGGLYALAQAANAAGCPVACYGHTHIAASREVEGVTCINPGAARSGQYAIVEWEQGHPRAIFKKLARMPE
nr:YfcE family phosphodiesterase [bacterium]